MTAISTSKIRNKMVIRKNRKEKEARILCCGSNPHSNGELFSRILVSFIFLNAEIPSITIGRNPINSINFKRILLFNG